MSNTSTSSFLNTGQLSPWIERNAKNQKQLQKESRDTGVPWDQLKNETVQAYSAFLIYLDLGPQDRSQTALAKILYGNSSSTSTIAKWSIEHDWISRAKAWDSFCMNSKITKMEKAVDESEDIMMSFLPKATLRLCQVAVGENSISRTELRALTDFLDRIGPTKRRRAAALQINNNLTVSAPQLPAEVQQDVSEIVDAEVIEESAEALIPNKLKDKRGKRY